MVGDVKTILYATLRGVRAILSPEILNTYSTLVRGVLKTILMPGAAIRQSVISMYVFVRNPPRQIRPHR